MEAVAIAKGVRIAPRKARLVIDLIRGKSVEEADKILKNINKESQRKYFNLSVDLLNVLLLACLLFVPFINYSVLNFLPKYAKSLEYFFYLVPMIVYEGKLQIVLNTYMKALRKERALMNINLLSLIISFLLCIVGYYYGSIDFIILSITFATILRSIILENFLNKNLNTSDNSWVLVFTIIILFVFLFSYFDLIIAFLLYITVYIIFLIIYKNNIKEIINFLRIYF